MARTLVTCLWFMLLGCSNGIDASSPDSRDGIDGVARLAPSIGVTISPSTGSGDPGVVSAVGQDGSVSWIGGDWLVPLPAVTGDLVSSLAVPVRDNGQANDVSDGNNVIAMLVSRVNGVPTTLNFSASNGTGAPQTLTISASHVVQDGEQLVLRLVALRGGAIPGPATHSSMVGMIRLDAVAVTTLVIPVTPPVVNFRYQTLYAVVTGGAEPDGAQLYVPLHLPVGPVIKGIRVRIMAPGTRALASLVSTTDDAQTFATEATALSSGVNVAIEETIAFPGISVTIAPKKQYIVTVTNPTGQVYSFSRVYRLEVDVTRFTGAL